MRLLIAGGGTGGHVYPALAVARSLLARADDAEIRWLGGHRGFEAAIVPANAIPLRRLWLRSLRSVGRDAHLVLDPVRLALSVPQAAALLAAWRPAAIFTTGGFVAIPVLIAAAAERIPVVMWEGNVVPGRSVRATARLATVLAVSFDDTCRALAADGGRCFVTGTPIRDVGAIDPTAAREHLGIGPRERMLLVFGGSQAVRRFNEAVSGALARLVERVHVVHVAGDEGYRRALADRDRLPEALRPRYHPFPFLRDEMLPTLAASDLVVGRAGSSTLAEVAALGRPIVVVPYPHAAGHQRANAEILAGAGAARLVEDEDFDAAALLDAATILDDPAEHARMSAAARSLARPGAADAVARLVLATATHRPLPSADEIDRVARVAP
ncbi:MAG TPA: UDP-N-acetylglucosamine--N-acetylmuramyl-(pentapeptide) pyrophosphoryl-undecaprenol N-acetylglucosamine transferase [Candidatus Limnocylindrales bacterium]|nr:UDP-N-acetylglucosamine--N-acetylmuramyl-(pentapeptide) pyrophosphoryl-undecaprenol N-acetylglucosamine transferase [Candidatus Limnocylindrales bacterium]